MKVDVRVLIVEVNMLISTVNLPVTSPTRISVIAQNVVLSCDSPRQGNKWRIKEEIGSLKY